MKLNRRQMMFAGALTASGIWLPSTALGAAPTVKAGWEDSPEVRTRFIRNHERPHFSQNNKAVKGSSKGKAILLSRIYERVTEKKFVPHAQGNVGTCAGEGSTLGAEFLTTTQIAMGRKNEAWKGKYSVEVTYGGGRNEIGKGQVKFSDGITVEECCQYMRDYGVVLRGKYGKYDLTTHNKELAKYFGRPGIGVPDELDKIAKEHPVKKMALVSSWDEAADAVYNGHPVVVGSKVGYGPKNRNGVYQTDEEGFLDQLEEWWHALLLIGIDRRRGKREGGMWANSWDKNWIDGPRHELGTPDGCFWADADAVNKAIKDGDAYALSDFQGFTRKNLDYLLI